MNAEGPSDLRDQLGTSQAVFREISIKAQICGPWASRAQLCAPQPLAGLTPGSQPDISPFPAISTLWTRLPLPGSRKIPEQNQLVSNLQMRGSRCKTTFPTQQFVEHGRKRKAASAAAMEQTDSPRSDPRRRPRVPGVFLLHVRIATGASSHWPP